jgi:hypothetical protein
MPPACLIPRGSIAPTLYILSLKYCKFIKFRQYNKNIDLVFNENEVDVFGFYNLRPDGRKVFGQIKYGTEV